MELWDEPRPLTQAEWDDYMCQLAAQELYEAYKPILEQAEDGE